MGYALALPGVRIGPATLDAHTLLFASLAILVGYQSLLFGLVTKTFAISEKLLPTDRALDRFFEHVNLERGLVGGVICLSLGATLLGHSMWQWKEAGFGPLDYSHTLRWVIPGATLAALGSQTILGSFFVSILGMKRR